MKTYKQYVDENYTHQVNEKEYEGGVKGCPYNYGFRDSTDCPGVDWDCAKCWGREIRPEDLQAIACGLVHDFQPVIR